MWWLTFSHTCLCFVGSGLSRLAPQIAVPPPVPFEKEERAFPVLILTELLSPHLSSPARTHLAHAVCLSPQYSEKEDKYEEEIKVLTDKLKEVRPRLMSCYTGNSKINLSVLSTGFSGVSHVKKICC